MGKKSQFLNSASPTASLAKKIRLHVINMTHLGKSSHVASGLSIADILAVLYGHILNIDPLHPKNDERDRFILSKGHAGAAVYAVLAESGFFSVEELKKHYQNGSFLSGHVSHYDMPGVELSTGSLGHGLPVATGMAKAAQIDGKKHRIFCLLSDGECDEGSNWEAILFAAHHKLNNLTVVIDYNKLQSLTTTEETIGLEPFKTKWEAFNWQVSEVNGHNHLELTNAFNQLTHQPHCIIAHTIKGKGISFMENQVLWHYRSPQGDEYTKAIEELSNQI